MRFPLWILPHSTSSICSRPSCSQHESYLIISLISISGLLWFLNHFEYNLSWSWIKSYFDIELNRDFCPEHTLKFDLYVLSVYSPGCSSASTCREFVLLCPCTCQASRISTIADPRSPLSSGGDLRLVPPLLRDVATGWTRRHCYSTTSSISNYLRCERW